ncbi:LppX_LprAFG lipoprotein [Nocardioides sp.]|uniref:LppX_LprAFG lipoprotein n=1 Tax=Nocardioides sp. TaxID=35761 RepID=UPI003D0B3812
MRNPVTARRLAAAAAAPLLLVGLVACGGDEKTAANDLAASSASPSETASDTPTTEATESEAAGEEIDPQDFADRMASTFTNTTTAQLEMTVSSSGLDMSANGSVDYTGDTPAMALKMEAASLGAGTIDMRLIDQVMYMSMPMLDPSGKFFKIDLNDPDNPLGDSMGDLSSFDPQSTLDTFTKGIKSVKLVGEEELDGETTTHYQVTSLTKDLGSTLGGKTAKLPKTFTYDIWLDGDDRMRKMVASVDKKTSMEMVMSNFGDPVDIKAPPASQVQVMPGM